MALKVIPLPKNPKAEPISAQRGFWPGSDDWRQSANAWRRFHGFFGLLSYMLQHDHLLEWRDVYHNIMLGLEIQKKKTPENLALVDELLEKYKLSDTKNKKPSALSGGMRQRIALIRTLATRPDLLLLDEPFSALDYQTRLRISADVRDIIKSEKKTAILVTHDISEAVSMADVVILLTKPPCTVKDIIPIEFEKNEISRNEIRTSKLFQEYFDRIWREMQDENTDL